MRIFNIDISRKGISPVVQVTEYDAMSRFFTLVLRNGSSDYEPPENPTYSVWYKTKDSTGWYDTITLPDESTRPAVVADGNAYTIEIAEQATTSCGELALMINGDDGYQLTVSGILLRSDDIPGYDGEEVENYYNVYIARMQENAARAENAAATAIEYGATVEVDETAQQLIITHTDNTEDVQTWVTEAEAWAVGQRDGVDVPSTDETYHNNAKYYAGQYTTLAGEVTDLKNQLIGEIEVTGKTFDLTWISGYTIDTNVSTGAFVIREYSGRRYAGPFKSIADFSVIPNVNQVAVIATDSNGRSTLNTRFKNTRIEVSASVGENFYILCDFDNDDYVPTALVEGDLLNINTLSDIIAYVIGNNVFRFLRGNLTDGINVSNTEYAMYQQNISVLPFDLIIPVSNLVRIKVFTYDDESGTNPTALGYVNENSDYTLKKNTCFRIGVHYRSNVTGIKMSDTIGMYETTMYKSLVFYANDYTHYNLMDCIDTELLKLRHIPINQNISVINHRGYNVEYPENTLLAFRKSRERGFNAVETDVRFTSDGVAVCLHDGTINRTSNGTGAIADMTYETALTYDFGSWKNSAYAGQKIPTFEEFLKLCRNIGLSAYVELKVGTQEQINALVRSAIKCGMKRHITWISYHTPLLAYVKDADDTARLGLLINTITQSSITNYALTLKTGKNDVFMGTDYNNLTNEIVDLCIENNLPIEVFTLDTMSALDGLNTYVTGITTNCLQANVYLYEKHIQ